eukprot:TRINITY_DN7174_c0_g1_i5.p1 TRINITY_DN7174_c0_g1~~TRINITY_DN7174_c0_g1_i5.p1  ORF type:complete len:480 (-),score=93.91 TRINITY_DN7174_c0_g1_i5:9-1256(-)
MTRVIRHELYHKWLQLKIPTREDPGFVRVDGDFTIVDTMLNLIWYMPQMKLSKDKVQQFHKQLSILQAECKLENDDEVTIRDLVDPDENIPVRFPDGFDEVISRRDALWSHHETKCIRWEMMPMDGNYFRIQAYRSKRAMFVWKPSVFEVHRDTGKTTITSPIFNLPMKKKFQPLYSVLAKLFQSSFTMLRQLGIDAAATGDESSDKVKLQVVTRIRVLTIPAAGSSDNVSYSLRWHLEGVVEGVVAVAMVRLDSADDELVEIQFSHRQNRDNVTTLEVSSQSVVVFSNTLPRRIANLTNYTAEPQERTFVLFYVIDPDGPLCSTASEISPTLLRNLIELVVGAGISVPIGIAKMIVAYAVGDIGGRTPEEMYPPDTNWEALRNDLKNTSEANRNYSLQETWYSMCSRIIETQRR